MGSGTRRPWDGTPRADDHDALARLLRETPEGAPVVWLARTLFGEGVESGDKDWQFVKRHCERYHRVFRPTARVPVATEAGDCENRGTEAGLLWVEPAVTSDERVFNTASKQSPSTEGVVDGVGSAAGQSATLPEALANAQGRLKRREALDTAEDWGLLLRDCAAKRLYHERSSPRMRTDTKYNTVARALASRDRVLDGFAEAAEAGATPAAVVTVTTGEGWCGSIYEAAAGLRDDVNLLKDKLKRMLGRAGRPPSLWVPDGSARGLPHAHLVMFDVDAAALAARERDLHDYWATHRGRGHQVDVLPMTATESGADADANAWEWTGSSPVDADGRSPATYLSKGPAGVASAAALNATELRAVADAHIELEAAPVEPGPGPDLPVDVAGVEGVNAHPAAVRLAAFFWASPFSRVAPKPSWADEDDRVAALREAVETDGQGGAA